MAERRILISGACGRMGRAVVKAVLDDPELRLVAAVDQIELGQDIAGLIGAKPNGVLVQSDLAQALKDTQPQVAVDFTIPATVMGNLRLVLGAGVNAVVGTTGISAADLSELEQLCRSSRANALIVPNFAIGAVLMMRFAAQAARYLPQVEIVELHHDRKLDAPSGTALKTAELIQAERGAAVQPAVLGEEKLAGARGAELGGVRIHSVRLPGLVAHQEVILGGEGQTLTIRHDTINRECFMPGVIMAVKAISQRPGLTYGLEKLLFND